MTSPDLTKARELDATILRRAANQLRTYSDMRGAAELDRIAAALSTLPQSIEPSEAMIEAGHNALRGVSLGRDYPEQIAAIYRAMCSAQGEG